jgi:dephospho-CoA kinase
MKKILVMGLPGAGKTTLSIELAKMLNAVHFNADEIRKEINKDLTFSIEDRIEQSRRR